MTYHIHTTNHVGETTMSTWEGALGHAKNWAREHGAPIVIEWAHGTEDHTRVVVQPNGSWA